MTGRADGILIPRLRKAATLYAIAMKILLTIIILFIHAFSFAQVGNSYLKLINKNIVNKKIIEKDSFSIYEYNYLGKMKLDSSNRLYHVICASSNRIKSPSNHGNHQIVFVNVADSEQIQYDLYYEGQLPFKIEADTLYFKYFVAKQNEYKIFSFKIGFTLPKYLCCDPDFCAERFNPNKSIDKQ